jgi:hypothetical protein
MTRVFLNGVYLCPNYNDLTGVDYDYAGKGSKIIFEMRLKPGDIIIIEKTFLGITYSRKFYRITESVMKGGYWRRVSTILGKRARVQLPPITQHRQRLEATSD